MVWNEPGKNNKDPWESGKHAPDLEQLAKNIQQRLSALFGGKRPVRNGGGHVFNLLWVVPLLIIAWLASGFFTVGAGDRGVTLMFGRITGIMQPGLHWHYPWPIGTHLTVNGVDQGRDYTHQYNQLITADGSVVTVTVQVHYRVSDIRAYLFKVAAPENGENGASLLLSALTDGAVRTAVARNPLTDVLGGGRDQVEALAHDLLQAGLKSNDIGITVTRLVFQRADVPDEVASAYADVRKAREDARQAQDGAQVYASRVVTEAQGASDASVTEAQAYQVTRASEAQADVAGFNEILAAYRAEPALTRQQLYLQTLQQVLGSVDKVVVDTRNGNVTVQLTPAPAGSARPVTPAVKQSADGKGKSGNKGGGQ